MKSKRTKKAEVNPKNKHENHSLVPIGTLVVVGGKENKGEDGPGLIPQTNPPHK